MAMVVVGFNLPSAAISDGCAQVKIRNNCVIPCCIILVIRFGRLQMAKKFKKGNRGASARKKRGMKKAKPAKRAKAKKRAPKPVPAPMVPSQPAPAPSTLGGMTEDQ